MKLSEYQKIYGHCNIPRKWFKDLSLSHWASRQKKLFRKGELEPIKAFKLQSIGFTGELFFQYKEKWNHNFEMLKHYKDEYGDSNFINKGSRKKFLSSWVITQRIHYREQKLSTEQINKLETLGFEWTYRDKFLQLFDSVWESSYKQLIEFYSEHKHFKVTLKMNKKLKGWIQRQRETFRNGQLNKNRIEKLNQIGFTWQGEGRHKKLK